MTIQMRLLLWFLPILSLSVSGIILFAYLNDLYHWIPHKSELSYLLISILILAFIVIVLIVFVSHKISQPVEKLNAAALAIASGDYGKTIHVEGPKEIKELAQTLSTMSQCLAEQIHRLQENSLVRERLYGAYECSLLLQHHMLQKKLEDFTSPNLSAKLIKVVSSTQPNGYFFDIEKKDDSFEIQVAEANEKGFQGMFHLLWDRKKLVERNYPYTFASLKGQIFQCEHKNMAPPLVWSVSTNQLLVAEEEAIHLEPGDFFFFYNNGFSKQFQKHQWIQTWFTKVLKHFATDSFESCIIVLSNELNFLANKQHISEDMYILCFRMENKLK